MQWLLSLLVFVNGLMAASVKAATQNRYAFSSATNLSFLLPLLLLLPKNDNPRSFFPSVYLLCVLLGMGSLAHHIRGCSDRDYRVLDHVFYLLTYGFLTARSAWSLCCHNKVLGSMARLIMLVIVSLIVIFYKIVLRYNVEFMVAFGCTSGIIVLFGVFWRRRQGLRACSSNLVLLLCTIALANAFNMGSSQSDAYVYDMEHGMWHLLAAQFQFMLISTLVTSGPIPLEAITMGMQCVLLIVFFVFRQTSVVGAGWYALVFSVPSLYLLVRIALKCRVCARVIRHPLRLHIERDCVLTLAVDSCQ